MRIANEIPITSILTPSRSFAGVVSSVLGAATWEALLLRGGMVVGVC